MAQKKISDLILRSGGFVDACQVPVEDATQTWRVTGAQIFDWITAKMLAGAIPAVPQTAVKTATYAILTTDSTVLLDASAGAFTATLPTAVGVKGKRYKIVHTGAFSANIATVATTSSQTIGGGATTFKLRSKNEMLEVESDNANWLIVNRYIPSTVDDTGQSFTTLTGTTGTGLTFGTNSVNKVYAQRIGQAARFKYDYRYTSAGTLTSGDMLWALPTGYEFASGTTYYTTAEGNGNWALRGCIFGIAAVEFQGTSDFMGIIVPYDSTHFRVFGIQIAGASPSGVAIGNGGFAPVGTSGCYSFDFTAPMKDFEG